MRTVLGCLAGALLTSPAFPQTPYGFTNVVSDAGAGGVAANNPWLGAQVGYKFGGTDSFSDNLLVGAKFLYDPLGTNKDSSGDDRGWHLPVMGNISDLTANASAAASPSDQLDHQAQQLISSAQGLNVGVYPYLVISRSQVVRVTAHSLIGWKLSSLRTPGGETVLFNQGRVAAGLEVAIGQLNEAGRLPITFSVTPVITFLSADKYEQVFGTRKSAIGSVELTGVMPVGSGFGLLFEGILSGGDRGSFRSGMVFLTAPE